MSKKNRNQSGHPPLLHHMHIDNLLRHARSESNGPKRKAEYQAKLAKLREAQQ